MSKGTIILDVDDTLGNLKERLQNIYRRKTGDHTISYNDWSDFNSVNRYNIDSDTLGDYLIEDRALELINPHDYVHEVTKQIRKLGYRIVIVTARAWMPNAYEVTKEWLNRHNIEYDDIIIVGLTESKVTATNHLNDIVAFVDDRLDYGINFLNSKRTPMSLVYAQPWNNLNNINMEGLIRINCLREILKYVK